MKNTNKSITHTNLSNRTNKNTKQKDAGIRLPFGTCPDRMS